MAHVPHSVLIIEFSSITTEYISKISIWDIQPCNLFMQTNESRRLRILQNIFIIITIILSQFIWVIGKEQIDDFTRKDAVEPQIRVRNLPRYVSDKKAPSKGVTLVEPDQILNTLTNWIPSMLNLVCRYTVKLAIRPIEASFSNDSFPWKEKENTIVSDETRKIQKKKEEEDGKETWL